MNQGSDEPLGALRPVNSADPLPPEAPVFLLPLVLGTAALVAVAATPLSIDLTVHARATAAHGGTVLVRGTVICSIQTTVSIEGSVIQPLNRSDVASGQFATDVVCDTTATSWTAVVVSDSDQTFRPGFASLSVRAVGFDPENGIFAGVESFGSLHLTRSPN